LTGWALVRSTTDTWTDPPWAAAGTVIANTANTAVATDNPRFNQVTDILQCLLLNDEFQDKHGGIPAALPGNSSDYSRPPGRIAAVSFVGFEPHK
jgi:hypothetical protein